MSGVLVPDDEAMIDDWPQPTVDREKGAGGLPPEVLLWHVRVLGVLTFLVAVVLGLLLLAWRRFWPILTRVHSAQASLDMPESPTTRGLRERLDRKKKR